MSWRLVLIDLLMMVYLLGVLGVTMVIGIDVDVNVVANALFKYVTWTTVYRGASTCRPDSTCHRSEATRRSRTCSSCSSCAEEYITLLHLFLRDLLQPCERHSSQRPGALATLLPGASGSHPKRHDGDLQGSQAQPTWLPDVLFSRYGVSRLHGLCFCGT